MPRKTTPLSATEVKYAKPKEKEYYLSDGRGLQLRILPTGTKRWEFNYTSPITRKRSTIGLGSYPDISLDNARKIAANQRELVAQGVDPKDERKRLEYKRKFDQENTLLNVATQWFEIKKKAVSSNYAADVWRSLELYIFPKLANIPIKMITAPEVIDVLRPIEAKGNLETIRRVNQRLNEIMTYATNCGLLLANPLTGISAGFEKPAVENFPTLDPSELPELMKAISYASIKRTTRCLIEFQLHTLTRPHEASGARWDEIDWANKVWIIPASRMKMRKRHRIPLTTQVLALLDVMKTISDGREYIFTADRDPTKASHSQTANMALKRMGFGGRLVAHGLRSLGSTTLNENRIKQGFNKDLIELALSHFDEDKIRDIYNRGDILEDRRPMMQWWSDHIEQAAQGSLSMANMKSV